MGLQEVLGTDDRPLQEIADVLAGSHKILLVTGAGISTSCGIPDFRSKDGLYNIIPEQAILPPTPPPSEPSTPTLKRTISSTEEDEFPSSQSSSRSSSSRRASASPSSKLRGQDLFDSRVFHNAASTTIFYRFIASLREKIRHEVRTTSSVHKFVRVLRDGGRLMRCYTQNIDGLEAREGLVTDLTRGKGNKRRYMKKHYESPRPTYPRGTDFDGGCEVVQLHGDLDKLRCTMCASKFEWTDAETEIYLEGAAPHCESCKTKSEERQASGKRGLATGSLRPNIVLYGEEHPSNSLLTPLIPFDTSCQPEIMIIMGTSLKVFGLQKMVREFAKAVHSQKKGRVIFVNRTRPAESVWEGIIDDFVAMDCDDWVEDLRRRRPDLWLRQGDLALNITKSSQVKRKRKSMEEDGIENTAVKKAKITVEIEAVRPKVQTPSTPSKKVLVPNPMWSPHNLARQVLSPLAQARRPLFSPLTSPVRPSMSPLTSPVRPSMSPLTSPVRPDSVRSSKKGLNEKAGGSPLSASKAPSGSKLRVEVFSEETEDPDTISLAKQQTPLPLPMLAPSRRPTKSGSVRLSECLTKERSKQTGLESRFLSSIKKPQILHYSPGPSDEMEDDLEGDTIEVETPSRGPGGRHFDALAKA